MLYQHFYCIRETGQINAIWPLLNKVLQTCNKMKKKKKYCRNSTKIYSKYNRNDSKVHNRSTHNIHDRSFTWLRNEVEIKWHPQLLTDASNEYICLVFVISYLTIQLIMNMWRELNPKMRSRIYDKGQMGRSNQSTSILVVYAIFLQLYTCTHISSC
jgi:hypothetical protein